MTTDTPRTDAARERYYDGKTSDWVHYTICGMIEQELAASTAEVARLDHLLADASETNHKLGAEVERLRDENKELRKLMRRSIDLTDKILGELPPPFPFEWFVDLSEKASAIDEKYSYLLK
jgi:hypothetical protein